MSDQTPSGKPDPTDKPIFDVTSLPKTAEDLQKTAEELRRAAQDFKVPTIEEIGDMVDKKLQDAPPHVQKAVGRGINIYLGYKQELAYALIGLVFLRLYKRRIQTKTIKNAVKALKKAGEGAPGSLAPNGTTYPTLFEIMEDLRRVPDMALIPHGGGMVHLLKNKDAMLTLFGNFEEMTNVEIWDKAAEILGLANYNR